MTRHHATAEQVFVLALPPRFPQPIAKGTVIHRDCAAPVRAPDAPVGLHGFALRCPL